MRIWAATLALVLAAAATSAQRQEVLVSAAASLAGVMEKIALHYETRTGIRVVVNTGASNTLARQIAAGAAVDVDSLLHSVAARHLLREQEADGDSTRGANEGLTEPCNERQLPAHLVFIVYQF